MVHPLVSYLVPRLSPCSSARDKPRDASMRLRCDSRGGLGTHPPEPGLSCKGHRRFGPPVAFLEALSGASWAVLETIGGSLGQCWAILEPSWAVSVAFRPGALGGRLGGLSGPTWGPRSRAVSEAILGGWGASWA
eukprot:2354272-Pyramimonas_sp.AAC.1